MEIRDYWWIFVEIVLMTATGCSFFSISVNGVVKNKERIKSPFLCRIINEQWSNWKGYRRMKIWFWAVFYRLSNPVETNSIDYNWYPQLEQKKTEDFNAEVIAPLSQLILVLKRRQIIFLSRNFLSLTLNMLGLLQITLRTDKVLSSIKFPLIPREHLRQDDSWHST